MHITLRFNEIHRFNQNFKIYKKKMSESVMLNNFFNNIKIRLRYKLTFIWNVILGYNNLFKYYLEEIPKK